MEKVNYNGKMVLLMMEIGVITKLVVTEFSITLMEIFMKVNSLTTKLMAKVTTIIRTDPSSRATGRMT